MSKYFREKPKNFRLLAKPEPPRIQTGTRPRTRAKKAKLTPDTFGDMPQAGSAADISAESVPKEQLMADAKRSAKIKNALDITHRAGAGGTIPGQVGLRPHGQEQVDIIEQLIGEKAKRPDRPFEKQLQDPREYYKNVAPEYNVVMALPRNFCPDCGRTDRPVDPRTAGGAFNLNMYSEDRPDLGLRAKEAYTSCFCQECCIKYRDMQRDPASKIITPTIRGDQSNLKRWAAQRLERVKRNTEEFIKARRLAGDESIYIKQER